MHRRTRLLESGFPIGLGEVFLDPVETVPATGRSLIESLEAAGFRTVKRRAGNLLDLRRLGRDSEFDTRATRLPRVREPYRYLRSRVGVKVAQNTRIGEFISHEIFSNRFADRFGSIHPYGGLFEPSAAGAAELDLPYHTTDDGHCGVRGPFPNRHVIDLKHAYEAGWENVAVGQ